MSYHKAITISKLLMLGMLCSGCWSMSLSSLWGEKDKQETTASLQPQSAATIPPSGDKGDRLSDDDFELTTQALALVLQDTQAGSSMPWENPTTGARGTVTPLSTSSTMQDGFVCREFLASHVTGDNERWLQGEACRVHQGKWQIKSLKPWAAKA